MTLELLSDPVEPAPENAVEGRSVVPWVGTTLRLFSGPAEVAPENAVEGRSVVPKMKASASIARGSLHEVFMVTPFAVRRLDERKRPRSRPPEPDRAAASQSYRYRYMILSCPQVCTPGRAAALDLPLPGRTLSSG